MIFSLKTCKNSIFPNLYGYKSIESHKITNKQYTEFSLFPLEIDIDINSHIKNRKILRNIEKKDKK